MKKIIILAVSVILSMAAFGYERTLFDGDIDHGGYGGPFVQWSTIDGKDVVMTGGRGGWIIDHTISIGGGGAGLATPLKYTNAKGEKLLLDMGFGGLCFQFIGNSDEVVHFNLDVMAAVGGVGFRRELYEVDDEFKYDRFYVLQPEVDIVMNVTSFFRISAGGGYRFVYDADVQDDTGKLRLTSGDLRGPTAKLAFNFGAF